MDNRKPAWGWIVFFLIVLVAIVVAAWALMRDNGQQQPEADPADRSVAMGETVESEQMTILVGGFAPVGESACTNALVSNISPEPIMMTPDDWHLVDSRGEFLADSLGTDYQGNPVPEEVDLGADTIEMVTLCFDAEHLRDHGVSLAHAGPGHDGTWSWKVE